MIMIKNSRWCNTKFGLLKELVKKLRVVSIPMNSSFEVYFVGVQAKVTKSKNFDQELYTTVLSPIKAPQSGKHTS